MELEKAASWRLSLGRGRWEPQSASPSQQRPDAVQLTVRDAQALPKLHAACPAARLHAELPHPRRESLRAMPSGRPRAVSRMAQAANLHLPPPGAFDHFDLDFHRRARGWSILSAPVSFLLRFHILFKFTNSTVLITALPLIPVHTAAGTHGQSSCDQTSETEGHRGDRVGNVPLHRSEPHAGGSSWVRQAL